jgi:hypothetical protein
MSKKIEVLPVEGIADLYMRYDGQMNPQPCYIELDCETATLRAAYSGEIGSAIPMRVYHGHCRRYSIPCLTGDAANELMARIAPIAQQIADGYTCGWDGQNFTARLSDDAMSAEGVLETMLERFDPSESDLVAVWDAGDYLSVSSPTVQADATDEALEAMAAEIESDAAADGCHKLEGALAYLEGLRDAQQLCR